MQNINPNLVTVGIAVFNQEKYISQCIKSILNQTYKEFVLIISDNNSNDKTAAIINSYAIKDARIKFIQQSNNIGMLDNHRAILNYVDTKYFLWCQGDDWWDVNHLQRLINLIQNNNNNPIAVSSGLINVNENGIEYSRRFDRITSLEFNRNERIIACSLRITLDWLYTSIFEFNALKESFDYVEKNIIKKNAGYLYILLYLESILIKIVEKGEYLYNNEFTLFKRNHSNSSDKRNNKLSITYRTLLFSIIEYYRLRPKIENLKFHIIFLYLSFYRTVNISNTYSTGRIQKYTSKFLYKIMINLNKVFFKKIDHIFFS